MGYNDPANLVTEIAPRAGELNKPFVMHTTHLDDWALWQTARRLSASTIRERVELVRRFHLDTGVQPANAEAIDIMRWMASKTTWSQASSRTFYSYLSSWFTWLQKQEVRPDNPMTKIGAPKQPERAPRPVSDEDVRTLLESTTNRRTHAMIALAAFEGLRVHEIAKVRADDLDLKRGTLRVRGKGGTDLDIPLHPTIADIATTMPRRGWWFPAPTRAGEHIHAKSVSRAIATAMGRCQIRGTPHCLRHWFASRLFANGSDLLTVKALMRHRSIQSTTIYTALPDEVRTTAVSNLDPWQGMLPAVDVA